MTGQLLGALDVTGGDHVASPHMLTLVRAAAAAAEAELRWQRLRALPEKVTRRTLPDPSPPPRCAALEVLGRDRAYLSLPGRQVELSLRHSELFFLLTEAALVGQGRTAEQLMLELHGTAPAVTIRAEMSRLRRVIGQDVLASRPYRLIRAVDSDLARVGQLLERGAHRQALDTYRGPLLPTSTAPHVVVLRARLVARIREALVSHGHVTSYCAGRKHLRVPTMLRSGRPALASFRFDPHVAHRCCAGSPNSTAADSPDPRTPVSWTIGPYLRRP